VDEGGGTHDARERLAVIGEIAAEVAHELRNTLQVIAASAYLARQDPAASAPHIAKIEKNARLAHAIVDDLMALARGESAHAGPVLLADVLVAARNDIEPDAVTWTDRLTPADLRVRAHPGLLGRLLHALYENAIAVSAPAKPELVTEASNGSGKVIIEVSDDGPGVSPELAPTIFDPLVTGRPGGTGLGLALAKRIAHAHGGTIALVASERGARFRIELPV
jgi:signal transduction histidine kinase